MKTLLTESFSKFAKDKYPKSETEPTNPWAVCNRSTGGKKKSPAKFERCVQHVKKQNREEREAGDLNPLHQAGGVAVRVTNAGLLRRMEALTQAVSRVIDLGFYAIDLILCKGEFHILEINPNPICHFYNSDNGRADFVRIYERLMRKYVLGERRPQQGPTGGLMNQRNGWRGAAARR